MESKFAMQQPNNNKSYFTSKEEPIYCPIVPRLPKIRLDPTKAHIIDASKKTRSLGHVQGLLTRRSSGWHMFWIEFSNHYATPTLMVPARIVPMNYAYICKSSKVDNNWVMVQNMWKLAICACVMNLWW